MYDATLTLNKASVTLMVNYQDLHNWLTTTPRANSFSECHLDLFVKPFRPLEWIDGTIEALLLARPIVTTKLSACRVAAAFALKTFQSFVGVTYSTREELITQFNDTPPSIYLFRQLFPWETAQSDFYSVAINVIGPVRDNLSLLHCEYLESGEDEYRRSLWLF